MVRVKICGITRLKDALSAVEAGADAIGFIFYEKSPRYIPLKEAALISAALPPFISRVGVFVNETEPRIRSYVSECKLDTLQFHGDETPEFCRNFSIKVIKAFRLKESDHLKPLTTYDVDAWLLDSFSEKELGGTGKVFDWTLATEAKKRVPRIILSGGLTPENVREAIRKVQPYAVDVSSGVEISPGKKDLSKVNAFVDACKKMEAV